MTDSSQIGARPAATLVLIRDGAAGLEVLMAARNDASGFAAGAYVFPGGRIDASDAELARSDDLGAAARIAAIRETWEECGVLLARRCNAGAVVRAAEIAMLRTRHGASFAPLIADGALDIAIDLLVPFAHWITPHGRPKRYDTMFFLAPFESDQTPRCDGHEAVEAFWARPADMIARAAGGAAKLVFATQMNLMKLARAPDVDAAMRAARVDRIVTVIPEIAETARGTVFRIPIEAGYGVSEVPAAGIPRA